MAPADVDESFIRLPDIFCFWLWPLFLSDVAADLFPRGARILRQRSKLSVECRPIEWCSCEPAGRTLDRPLVEEIWSAHRPMRRSSNIFSGQRLDPRGSGYDRKPHCRCLLIAAAAGIADLSITPAWAVCHDIGGEYAGTVTGCMNTFANVGGAIAPIAIGYAVSALG